MLELSNNRVLFDIDNDVDEEDYALTVDDYCR